MKITFIGAAHEVTGSCTYIEVGDKKGIVDYGMEQGRNLYENAPLPVAPGELDFVLLTHAHIDHSGMLPALYKQGFRGSVYASAATCQLCDIMLRDSANIQMQEAEWKSRKAMRAGGAPVLLSFTDSEALADEMLSRMDGVLFTGGGDVNPARYGEEMLPCCGAPADNRDQLETLLLRCGAACRFWASAGDCRSSTSAWGARCIRTSASSTPTIWSILATTCPAITRTA